jgi:hypothetical protein
MDYSSTGEFYRFAMSLNALAYFVSSSLFFVHSVSSVYGQMMSFRPVKFANGTIACAAALPSLSSSVAEIDDILVEVFPALAEVPEVVRCGYRCTTLTSLGSTSGRCTGFNYRATVGLCEFYSSALANCTFQTGCSYYTVKLYLQLTIILTEMILIKYH